MDRRIYVARSTDTLWGIARDHLGDPMLYKELKEWNKLPGLVVRSGQKLFLYDPKREK